MEKVARSSHAAPQVLRPSLSLPWQRSERGCHGRVDYHGVGKDADPSPPPSQVRFDHSLAQTSVSCGCGLTNLWYKEPSVLMQIFIRPKAIVIARKGRKSAQLIGDLSQAPQGRAQGSCLLAVHHDARHHPGLPYDDRDAILEAGWDNEPRKVILTAQSVGSRVEDL